MSNRRFEVLVYFLLSEYCLLSKFVLNNAIRRIVGGDGSPRVWQNPSLRARGSHPKTGVKNPGRGWISAGKFGAMPQTREKGPGREKARIAGEVVETSRILAE